MRAYTEAMSTNRPTPAVKIIATVATMVIVALAIVGAILGRSHAQASQAREAQAERVSEIMESLNSEAEKSPSAGGSEVCTISAERSRKCYPGGRGGWYRTRGGHALKPAEDSTAAALLHSEFDEVGPADMPGRVPGRGGWVSEEGEDWA